MERPNIYQAPDHRSFLRQMFAFQKENIKAFSYAFCARKLKVSLSYLKNVLSSKRNLNLEHAFSTCDVFGLNPLEQRFFLLLLLRDQTKNFQTRSYFEEILIKFRSDAVLFPPDSVFHGATTEDSLFSDPLTHLLLSLTTLQGFSPDSKWLKAHVNEPSYSEEHIAKAFEALLANGLLALENGTYVIKKEALSTPSPFDLRSFKVYRTGLKQVDLALEAPLAFRPCQFFMMNLGVNRDEALQILDIFNKCREEIVAIANQSKDSTHVISISNNLLTVSGPPLSKL